MQQLTIEMSICNLIFFAITVTVHSSDVNYNNKINKIQNRIFFWGNVPKERCFLKLPYYFHGGISANLPGEEKHKPFRFHNKKIVSRGTVHRTLYIHEIIKFYIEFGSRGNCKLLYSYPSFS